MTANPKVVVAIAAGVALLLAAIPGIGLVAHWSSPSAAPILPPAETGAAATHLPFGPVRPTRAVPDMVVTLSNGSARQLRDVLTGHWTLVQLMFTGCSTTCPVQGAIFQETQKRLVAVDGDVRLLSLSIDPLGDTPARLAEWQRQFAAGERWQAAVPRLEDLGPLLDVLGGRGDGVDIHNARVFVITPNGELAYITEEMPAPQALADLARDALDSSAGGT